LVFERKKESVLYSKLIKISKVGKIMKIVNVELPDAVHKAVKKRAIDEDTTMKAWIADVVGKAVDGEGEKCV